MDRIKTDAERRAALAPLDVEHPYEPYPDTAELCAGGVVVVYPQPRRAA